MRRMSSGRASCWPGFELLLTDRPDLWPEPRAVVQAFGRGSVTFGKARLALEALWAALRDDPETRLKRDLWDGLLREAYGEEVGEDSLFLQHTYLTIVVKAIAARVLDLSVDDPAALLSGRALADEGIVGAVEAAFLRLAAPGGRGRGAGAAGGGADETVPPARRGSRRAEGALREFGRSGPAARPRRVLHAGLAGRARRRGGGGRAAGTARSGPGLRFRHLPVPRGAAAGRGGARGGMDGRPHPGCLAKGPTRCAGSTYIRWR